MLEKGKQMLIWEEMATFSFLCVELYYDVILGMERIKSKLKSCGQQSCFSQDECGDRLESLLAVFSFL